MGSGKYNILCFVDDETGRDVEIVMPVLIYAELFLGCRVEFAFAWDAIQIYRKKPDLVFLANTVGSPFYYQVAQYARESGIKVFALVSEGNFRTDGTFDYWGYNKSRNLMQEYVCLWSKRTYDFLSNELPQLKHKMVITGATGFDRYKIYQFESRQDFFRRNHLRAYKKVIGYAGWAFGKLYNEQGRTELLYYFKNDASRFKWLEAQMKMVEKMLRQAIEQNPDTLFILKRHPNEANPSIVGKGINEMINLEKYENAIYITEGENIHDLIYISDLWLGFETTTALEAWLMGKKPTILLNPDPDFNRDELYKGSLITKDGNQLQNLIDEFYQKGTITQFHDPQLKANREHLIEDIIGFGDGLNHLRAGYYLKKVLEEDQKQEVKVSFRLKYFLRFIYLRLFSRIYHEQVFSKLPKFKKTVWVLERFRLERTRQLKEKYKPYLIEFYRKQGIADKVKEDEFLQSLW